MRTPQTHANMRAHTQTGMTYAHIHTRAPMKWFVCGVGSQVSVHGTSMGQHDDDDGPPGFWDSKGKLTPPTQQLRVPSMPLFAPATCKSPHSVAPALMYMNESMYNHRRRVDNWHIRVYAS